MTLKTILLVDDSEAEQFLYKSIIEVYDREINVISAYDGQEALEILGDGGHKIDAVLLDINMPRIDGFQFLELYQENFHSEEVVVAMVTSSSQKADKDRALSYKVVSKYFEKPLTTEHVEELSEIVEEKKKG